MSTIGDLSEFMPSNPRYTHFVWHQTNTAEDLFSQATSTKGIWTGTNRITLRHSHYTIVRARKLQRDCVQITQKTSHTKRGKETTWSSATWWSSALWPIARNTSVVLGQNICKRTAGSGLTLVIQLSHRRCLVLFRLWVSPSCSNPTVRSWLFASSKSAVG